MEKAVRKMSGAVADRFCIPLRGYLRDGYSADVTVFNPETMRQWATAPSARLA
jgi:N-acyl-D-amino-acid deacylase